MRFAVAAIAAAALFASCSNPQRKVFEIRQDAAQTYYDTGDLQRASGMARQALEIEPNDVKTLAILGMSLSRIGASSPNANDVVNALNEAIGIFEKAEAHGGSENFAVEFGHGTARTQRARMYMLRAESNEKRVADAMDPNKKSTVDLLQRPEDIQKDLDRLRAESVSDRKNAEADLIVAEDRLIKTYRLNTNFLETTEHLQALYALRNNFASSAEWGEKSMALITTQRDERVALLKRTGLPTAAIDEIRASLDKLDQKEANGRSLLALAYNKMGKHNEALLDLDRVLTLNPDRIEDYFNRGVARQDAKDYRGAIGDYETFLRRSTLPTDSQIVNETWERINSCKKELGTGRPAAPLSTKPQ